jgi:hypothetical protein
MIRKSKGYVGLNACRIKMNISFMALFVALLLCGSAAARSTPDSPTTPQELSLAKLGKNTTLSLAEPHTAVIAAADKVKAAIQTAVKPVTAAAAVHAATKKEGAASAKKENTPASKEAAAATNSKQQYGMQQGGMMPGMQQGYMMPGYGMPG